MAPDLVLLHSCVYNTEEKEWIVCVASYAYTSYSLFLHSLILERKK